MCCAVLRVVLCVQDDPSSPEYNVPDRVNAFVAAAQEWSAQVQGNDVLFMMGSDFQYANAHAWFVNLDRCGESNPGPSAGRAAGIEAAGAHVGEG